MTCEELAAAGFAVGPAAYARLARFVELLLLENRRLNLTALRDSEQVWRLHVCESLALLPLVAAQRPRRLLDLGTGGGIPGLPLACVTEGMELVLLDAIRKKVEAIERMVARLELANVRTLWGRAETLAHEPQYREVFDAVTARAVAALPVVVEYGAAFVRLGGQCWFAKPPAAVEREVAGAQAAADRCGLEYVGSHGFRVPDGPARVVLIYHKRRPTPENLPRPPGRPERRPL